MNFSFLYIKFIVYINIHLVMILLKFKIKYILFNLDFVCSLNIDKKIKEKKHLNSFNFTLLSYCPFFSINLFIRF